MSKDDKVGRFFGSVGGVLVILFSLGTLLTAPTATAAITTLTSVILITVLALVSMPADSADSEAVVRNNERYKKLSVVGVILRKQLVWRNVQFSLLCIAAIFYIIGSFAVGREIDSTVLWFVLSLYGLLYFRLYLLERRIRSGTYGTTEEDAREIISFILRHPSLMGGDDDQGRPIITTADMRGMAEEAVRDAAALPVAS
jgi:hypothetical protein